MLNARPILLLLLCITLSGCGIKLNPFAKTPPQATKAQPPTVEAPQPPPPPPTEISASISTSTEANPDNSGRPSPLVVRIYELKDLGAFDAADFNTLFREDTGALGSDLVHREEYHMLPGTQRSYHRKPPAETRYLAVMAGYRKINQAIWKASVPIPPDQTSHITILMDALSISIQNN